MCRYCEEQPLNTFNPNDHLTKLKSGKEEQDYLEVKWRIVWFRSKFPHGKIHAEEVLVDLDRVVEKEVSVWDAQKRQSVKVLKSAKGYARFHATVDDGHGGIGEGTGSETAVDFGDYCEKAETKAIGRALAAAGYGTQFAPELNELPRIVDSPVTSASNGHQNGNDNNVSAQHANNSSRPSQPVANNAHADNYNEANTNATEQQIASIRKLCTHLNKAEPENVNAISFLAAKKLLQQLTAEYKENRQGSGQNARSH